MSMITAGGAHAATARLDVHEIVRRLNGAVGATLVAALAGARNPKIGYRWARADGPTPHRDSITRLQFAYEQWQQIAAAEGEHVARMWFVGANPRLDWDTPTDAIRDGRFKDVAAAAAAMTDDGYTG